MLSVVLFILVAALIIGGGIALKVLSGGSSTVFVLTAICVRLILGSTVFYFSAFLLAFYILFRYALKVVNKSAHDKIFGSDGLSTFEAMLSVGLMFVEFTVLTLCFSFNYQDYTISGHNFQFFRLAFFTTLGTTAAIGIAKIADGFAKSGFKVANSQKSSPLEIGSITLFGALAAAIVSFAVGVLVYFVNNSTIGAMIVTLLSFIGYLLRPLLAEYFEERTDVAVTAKQQNDFQSTDETTSETKELSKETSQTTENTAKSDVLKTQNAPQRKQRRGVKGFDDKSVTFATVFIVSLAALIISLLIR